MKRYGALTPPEKLRLVLVFLAVQVPIWIVFGNLVVRVVLALLTAAVLAVAAVTRPPTRRGSPR